MPGMMLAKTANCSSAGGTETGDSLDEARTRWWQKDASRRAGKLQRSTVVEICILQTAITSSTGIVLGGGHAPYIRAYEYRVY